VARRFDILIFSALAFLVFVSVLGTFARLHSVATMAVSFRHVWLVLAFVLTLCFCVRVPHRHWCWALCAFVVAAFHASAVLPVYRSVPNAVAPSGVAKPDPDSPPKQPAQFRVVTANLKGRNSAHSKVLHMVQTRSPDLLVTQETYANWRKVLDPLLATNFTHRVTKRHFGIYSRWPVRDARLLPTQSPKHPVVRFDWLHPQQTISVIAVHPSTPRRQSWASRNRELEEIAALVEELPRPALVLGDLNTALWDPAFETFHERIDMHHARQGQGILPSFCKVDYYLRFPRPLSFTGTPIDHIFHSHELRCEAASVLRGIGSDHYPFEADFRIERQ